MGKYVATKGVYQNTKEFRGPNATLTHNSLSEWLYGPWTKEKLYKYELMDKVPVLSSYMDFLLDVRRDEEYFRRYGLDYSDIHDPRRLHQSRSAFRDLGTVFNLSANVARLYS